MFDSYHPSMFFGISSMIQFSKPLSNKLVAIMGRRCPRFNPLKMAGAVKKLKFQSLFGSDSSSGSDSTFEKEWQEYMIQCTQLWQQEVDHVLKPENGGVEKTKDSVNEVGESSRAGAVREKGMERWDLSVIEEEDEEEMMVVREKAKEIGKHWKRSLMEEFEGEGALEPTLGRKNKKISKGPGMDDVDSKISHHPSTQKTTAESDSGSIFSILSSKYFACCSPKCVKQENVIKETPSTEGQMEGEEFTSSFRFDVQSPIEDMPDPSEMCAWWPIPPSYCPLYGRYIYPTQQNFYLLESFDDSDWAEARRKERTEQAV